MWVQIIIQLSTTLYFFILVESSKASQDLMQTQSFILLKCESTSWPQCRERILPGQRSACGIRANVLLRKTIFFLLTKGYLLKPVEESCCVAIEWDTQPEQVEATGCQCESVKFGASQSIKITSWKKHIQEANIRRSQPASTENTLNAPRSSLPLNMKPDEQCLENKRQDVFSARMLSHELERSEAALLLHKRPSLWLGPCQHVAPFRQWGEEGGITLIHFEACLPLLSRAG